MKLVIEISEELYKRICESVSYSTYDGVDVAKAVKTGTPLPKGHGRLIDISKLDNDRIESDNPIIYLTLNGEDIEAVSLDYLDNLQTIIPADKEEENGTI